MVLACALAAGAIAVRLPGLGQSLWEDEVASARVIAQPSLIHALRQVTRTESTPPLWYVLMWAFHRLGMPIHDGRLFSVLCGAALAVLVVVLARRLVAFTFALAAGALVALGSEFVFHGSELRAYEPFAAIAAGFAVCIDAQLRRPSRRRAAALAAVVAAGSLTHFFFAFTALGATAWALADPALRGRRRDVLGPLFVGAAVAALWLPVMLLRQYQPGRLWWIGDFRLRGVVAVPLRLFTYAYSQPVVGPTASALTFALVAVGGLRLARRSALGRLVLVLGVAPIAAAAMAWAAGMPIFDLRNLIGVGPFVAVSLVSALEGLPALAGKAAALVAVAAVGAALVVSGVGFRPRYEQMARALVVAGWDETQPIAVFGDPARVRLPLEWYLPHQPELTIAHLTSGRCPAVYVARRNGTAARIRRDDAGAGRLLRGATFLVHVPRIACSVVLPRRRAS